MSQYKRKLKKGDKWYYKFSFQSKTYFSSCMYFTKQQAKKAEINRYLKVQYEALNVNATTDIYLSELIEKRLKVLSSTRSKKYLRQNQDHFREFQSYFGNVLISKISKASIIDFLVEKSNLMKAKNKTNHTVNSKLRTLKALINFGIDNLELNIQNPCRGIKRFPIDKHLKYIPSDEEINNVKILCDDGQKLLIDFVTETGARINEALNLTSEDIYQDFLVLFTRKSYNSNRIPRKVPIPNCFIGKTFQLGTKPFGRWTDTPKFIDKIIRSLMKENPNVRLWGWHSLRHRYASKLSKEGRPLFEIMSLLGHNNLSTTQQYLQFLS